MALRITRELLDTLRQHGERTYPHECCGILVGVFGPGKDRIVKRVVPCANTSEESLCTHYQISPADLVQAQREARPRGSQIVGFYHSHPDQPAQWSAIDLAEATWTNCSYVITCIENGKAAATSSFLLRGDEKSPRFEDEAILLAVSSR